MECCESDAAEPSEAVEHHHGGEDESTPREEWELVRLAIATFLAGNSMIVGLAINTSAMEENVRLFIEIALLGGTVIVLELIGRRLLRRVWQSLRNGQISFEFLFVLGVFGALGASVFSMVRGEGPVYFEVASLLLVVYAAGERIGRVSRRRGLELARDFGVDEQRVRRESSCGHSEDVPLDAIEVGDRVIIQPGETVPVDGMVREGEAFVRDAHVTGEWASTVKRPGDEIHAGSEVYDEALIVEVQAGAGERLIDAIRASVEAAWERPSEWQVEANRIVQWFFPAVLAATATTFVYWGWSHSWETALFNSLAVLLIACPCAFGFAVPLAVWMTLGRYADHGIVAEEGDIVDRLARCDVAVFDKTGTLTTGGAQLVDLVSNDKQVSRGEVLALARLVERGSEHPVATAFERESQDSAESRFFIQESRPIPGAGVEGRIKDNKLGVIRQVAVGTEALIPGEALESWRRLQERLKSNAGDRTLAIMLDGAVVGAAAVAEKTAGRVGAMQRELKELQVMPVLVTGDSSERAERLGFERVYAEMKPDEKERLVEELGESHDGVLYVGDGVNDAAAMASAAVGIAKAEGSALTVDAADATWHGSDPTDVSRAVRGAREAVSVIRTNLGYAVAYNVVGIGVAAAGFLHPVAAAVLMVVSSLFVTWRTALTLDT